MEYGFKLRLRGWRAKFEYERSSELELLFLWQNSTDYQKEPVKNSIIFFEKILGAVENMDYYNRIQNAIEFIEENLEEPLNIKDIAARAHFSPFHFQRLFQTISGYSVQEYIRKRRLTEAATILKETNMNILEIAISFQYGSQEAFTRAFESYFGMTPAKYRKIGVDVKYLAKVNFMACRKTIQGDIEMNKPEIIHLNNIGIIGYEYRTTLSGEAYFEDIPRFYHDFGSNEYYMRIAGRISPAMAYGISCNFHDNGNFSFIVGEAASQGADALESGFVSFEIPHGRYAEFKVHGPAVVVQNAWRYIYGVWLPNSNYERREGPDFEVTDVCNSFNELKMKIYIPIK